MFCEERYIQAVRLNSIVSLIGVCEIQYSTAVKRGKNEAKRSEIEKNARINADSAVASDGL